MSPTEGGTAGQPSLYVPAGLQPRQVRKSSELFTSIITRKSVYVNYNYRVCICSCLFTSLLETNCLSAEPAAAAQLSCYSPDSWSETNTTTTGNWSLKYCPSKIFNRILNKSKSQNFFCSDIFAPCSWKSRQLIFIDVNLCPCFPSGRSVIYQWWWQRDSYMTACEHSAS